MGLVVIGVRRHQALQAGVRKTGLALHTHDCSQLQQGNTVGGVLLQDAAIGGDRGVGLSLLLQRKGSSHLTPMGILQPASRSQGQEAELVWSLLLCCRAAQKVRS
jgi:hypothetical protein